MVSRSPPSPRYGCTHAPTQGRSPSSAASAITAAPSAATCWCTSGGTGGRSRTRAPFAPTPASSPRPRRPMCAAPTRGRTPGRCCGTASRCSAGGVTVPVRGGTHSLRTPRHWQPHQCQWRGQRGQTRRPMMQVPRTELLRLQARGGRVISQLLRAPLRLPVALPVPARCTWMR